MYLATRRLHLLDKFIKISSKEKIEKIENFFKKEIAEEILRDIIRFKDVIITAKKDKITDIIIRI